MSGSKSSAPAFYATKSNSRQQTTAWPTISNSIDEEWSDYPVRHIVDWPDESHHHHHQTPGGCSIITTSVPTNKLHHHLEMVVVVVVVVPPTWFPCRHCSIPSVPTSKLRHHLEMVVVVIPPT